MQTTHIPRRIDVLPEEALGLAAFGCSVFLLFGIVAPRTSWSRGQGPIQVTTDSAGWNALVTLSGIIALAALAVAVFVWSRRLAVAAVLVATTAFAFAAYVAGSYWLAISRGALLAEVAEWGPKWTVHPTPAPPFFALAGVIGAISALTLVVLWARAPRV